MIKIGKYLHCNIILLCNDFNEEIEPKFYYQSIYSIDDLIKICSVFKLYSKKDKLYKLFINIFNNNKVK